MLIPNIHPDEFGPGYMIRLGLINGFKTEKEVIDAIRQNFSISDEHHSLTALHLSTVLGVNIEQFCQQHTVLPLHRSITSYHPDVEHGSLKHKYAVMRYGHLGLTKELKVCRSCLDEDVQYWGHAYYRRSHQFPGIRYCTKHGNNPTGALYSVSPKLFLNPDLIKDHAYRSIKQHQESTIDRYHQLVDGICNMTFPIKLTKIITHMQVEANLKGLGWSAKNKNKLLFSDFIMTTLPTEWAQELISNLHKKVKGERFSAIDGLLSPQKNAFKSSLYILGLASLNDDPDTAMFSLEEANLNEEKPIKPNSKYGDDYWLSEKFRSLYIECKGTATLISIKLGVHPSTVLNGIRLVDFPILGIRGPKVFKAFEMYKSGYTFKECITLNGVNRLELDAVIRICSMAQDSSVSVL